MAVYTKINNKDLSTINKQYKTKKFVSFKGIKKELKIRITYLIQKMKSIF